MKNKNIGMVKTLQRKFILSAMLAITLLIAVLIGGINILNAVSVNEDIDRMMSMLSYGDGFDKHKNNNSEKPDGSPFKPDDRNPARNARYIAAKITPDGEITDLDLSHINSVSEQDASAAIQSILSYKNTEGNYGDFAYRISLSPDGLFRTIILADVSGKRAAFISTLVISVAAGVVCWVLMLLLISLLSKKAIRPIAENIEKQKQFVTNAGHEIKTPLAIILANTDAMELINGETKWSRNIRAQVIRLSGLMQNLLTLSRMDEQGASVLMSEFDLSAVATDTVSAFSEPAALREIELTSSVAESVKLNGSREHIIQLLTVLLDNAVKYTDEGGKIVFELSRQDKNILISIKNTCPPIEKPDRLFDRFYREDSARTQKNGGYGIGLSVAKAIVTMHKGSINAEYSDGMLNFKIRL